MTPVRLETAAPQSQVKHSTTEPLRSLHMMYGIINTIPWDHVQQKHYPLHSTICHHMTLKHGLNVHQKINMDGRLNPCT